MKFKYWIEEHGQNREEDIRRIWNDTFKALQIGGEAKADQVRKSLQQITAGSERTESANSTIINRLKDVFARLKATHPEFNKTVDDAIQWLGTDRDTESGQPNSPQKTVEGLLQRMFGVEKFQELLNTDDKSSDTDLGLTGMNPAGTSPQSGEEPQPPVPPDQQQQPVSGVQQPGMQPQVPQPAPFMQPANPQMPQTQMAWSVWKGKRLQD